MTYIGFAISINENSNFTNPCLKNIRDHKLYHFLKKKVNLKIIGLLLGIAAQLIIEPDDFREFSFLLLTYYDHFQREGFDEAPSANISNIS